MKQCCRYCKDRYPGCHSECERYAEFRKEVDRLNRKHRAEKACHNFSPFTRESTMWREKKKNEQ